jgi:hypothetical protein
MGHAHGGAPGRPDGNDNKEEEAKVLAMQWIEKSCRDMAADINMDLSGKPPPSSLGTFKPAIMVPAFDKAIFHLGRRIRLGRQ